MAEVVAKSKMHKANRQREKAHVDEETTALDKQLPDILRMLNGGAGAARNEGEAGGVLFGDAAARDDGAVGKGVDEDVGVWRVGGGVGDGDVNGADGGEFNYERVYLELAGDKRAHATDRIRTQEEKDAEERNRLEALEKLRLHRMSAIDDDDARGGDGDAGRAKGLRGQRGAEVRGTMAAHVGGDDLDDDFVRDTGGDEDSAGADSGASDSDGSSAGGAGTAADGADGSGGGGMAGGVEAAPAVTANPALRPSPSVVNIDAAQGDEDDGPPCDLVWAAPPTSAKTSDDRLPFVYTECPPTYSALSAAFEGLTAAQCGVVLTRLRKCFAVSLDPPANKTRLAALLRATLTFVDVAAATASTDAALLQAASGQVSIMLPHIYELAAASPEVAVAWARNHLEDMYTAVTRPDAGSSGLSLRLPPGRLLSMRCMTRLFPGSDLRHAIVTPFVLLLSHCLSHVPILTAEDASSACFCAALLLELLAPARRFSGELVSFIGALLSAAGAPSAAEDALHSNDARMEPGLLAGAGGRDVGPLVLSDCMPAVGAGDAATPSRGGRREKKQRVLNAVDGLAAAVLYGGELKSIRVVMSPVLDALQARHGASVAGRRLHAEILRLADVEEAKRGPLTLYAEKKGAGAPRLLNPKFRSENGVYAGKQRSAAGVALSDMESQRRLRQQVKKEARSAARELRRDAEAVGAVRIREDDERDAICSAKGAQARAFFEQQRHEAKLQSKKVAVGREGLAAAGRKRKKW